MSASQPSDDVAALNAARLAGDISITADGMDMQDELNQMFHSGVKVSRKIRANGISWEITFLAFDGILNLPTIIQDAVTGATLVANRLQEGTASAQGYVTISLDGNSVSLPLDATEQQVEEMVVTNFPTVSACSVLVAKNVPGRYLNYAYPLQWVLRYMVFLSSACSSACVPGCSSSFCIIVSKLEN